MGVLPPASSASASTTTLDTAAAPSVAKRDSRPDGSSSSSAASVAGKDDKEVVQGGLDAIAEGPEVDDVFGAQGEGTVNYRSVGWVWTTIILMKTQIGLGVLTIPSAFHTLGLVPGLIVLCVMAIMTGWTDYEIGIFKINHPQVYSLSDCGKLMFGRPGSFIFAFATWMYMAMTTGSAFISISTAFNAMSLHGACTAVFVVVAALMTFPLAALPKLEQLKFLSWIALVAVISSVLLVTIAIPVGGRPALAPQEGPWDADFKVVGNPTFAQAMNAISNILFAYSGTPLYLPIASEMRNPRDFRKAVVCSQTIMTCFYIVVGCVVYRYAGQYVANPALGTAGVLIKRIAYGIGLPGLLFTSVIYNHLAGKYIFVRVLRGSKHLNHSTPTHWLVWFACIFGCLMFSYIVASAIPVFGGLVGLVASCFGTAMALHAEAFMWLYDIRDAFKVKEKRTLLLWCGVIGNVIILGIASFLLVGGTYGSVLSIRDEYAASGGRPWSCADNSGSV
ncbi:uncharacterized protein JCM10292_007119 [Rhodotorula paludigena]|uniref:uncharacterized protein n=1 Tax=Rhodotorula paludigena TaxID=86838 RepID=UPI003172F33E